MNLTGKAINYPKELTMNDQPYLAIVPSKVGLNHVQDKHAYNAFEFGHLFCYLENSNSPGLFTPQVLPRRLEYSSMKQWLAYCKLHHKGVCHTAHIQSPDLKLIDCESLLVIETPPLCSYAALGYVWGPPKGGNCYGDTKSSDSAYKLPNTILDAITVTKALGLMYLWVDKFCINQNNTKEKHIQ